MLPLHHDPGEPMLRGMRFSRVFMSAPSSPVGTAGFEPAISCSQGRRIARLSHIPARKVKSIPTVNTGSGRPDSNRRLKLPELADCQAFPRPGRIAREGVEPSSPP